MSRRLPALELGIFFSSAVWHRCCFVGVLGELCVPSVFAGRVYQFLLLGGQSYHVREELCVPEFTCMSGGCSTTSEYALDILYLRRWSMLLSSDILRVGIVGCWLAHDGDDSGGWFRWTEIYRNITRRAI
jgi:hypothetical protein